MNKNELITGVTSFYNNKDEYFSFSTPTHVNYMSSLVEVDDLILDFGCGYGRTLYEFQKLGYRNLYGIDISEKFITRAKSNSSNINYVCSDYINYFEEKFDFIIFSNILVNICFDEMQNILIETAIKIIKPTGRLIVIDFVKSDDIKYTSQYKLNFEKFGEDGIYNVDGCLFKHHTSKRIKELKSFFYSCDYKEEDVFSLGGNKMRQFVLTGQPGA